MSIAKSWGKFFNYNMGSKKKKQQKKKDFQKVKLRVGKTAAKPDNYTDTSFTARSISLPNQTLNKTTALKEQADLTHHLQLAKHHSASTRKEVLQYIESHLPSNPSLYKQILTLTVSLITDQSASVRLAFVSLLSASADKQPGLLELHMRSILLFIHSAMSHIQGEIRASSSAVLDVMVKKAPLPLVRGHFVKTLRSYFSLMAWTLSGDKKAVSLAVTTTATLGGLSKKTRINHLGVLRGFLDAALFENQESNPLAIDWSTCSTVHPQTQKHMLPANPQAYSPLKLYVQELPSHATAVRDDNAEEGAYSLGDIDAVSTEDLATRRKIMHDVFFGPLMKNLQNIVKEGGEVGRVANSCVGVLERFEKAYKVSEEN